MSIILLEGATTQTGLVVGISIQGMGTTAAVILLLHQKVVPMLCVTATRVNDVKLIFAQISIFSVVVSVIDSFVLPIAS